MGRKEAWSRALSPTLQFFLRLQMQLCQLPARQRHVPLLWRSAAALPGVQVRAAAAWPEHYSVPLAQPLSLADRAPLRADACPPAARSDADTCTLCASWYGLSVDDDRLGCTRCADHNCQNCGWVGTDSWLPCVHPCTAQLPSLPRAPHRRSCCPRPAVGRTGRNALAAQIRWALW